MQTIDVMGMRPLGNVIMGDFQGRGTVYKF